MSYMDHYYDIQFKKALWEHDKRSVRNLYNSYSQWRNEKTGDLMYPWGTSPARDTDTYHFLQSMIVVMDLPAALKLLVEKHKGGQEENNG